MSQPVENQSTQGDDAIAQRLARLNTMLVDSSRLDAFIRQRIPHEAATVSRRSWLLRPMNAIAASLIGAVFISVLVVALNGRPAAASPAQIAKWHEQMISEPDGQNVMAVTNMKDANAALASRDPKAPAAPEMEMGDGQMSCCSVRRIGRAPISCLMMQRDAAKVMVCLGDAEKIKIPVAQSTMTRGGVTYHLMTQGNVNIVMSTRDGRWIACTGKLPFSALIDTAAGLRF